MSQITQRFQNIYQLQNHYFEIIGCGSIGSYTAMNLARAGAENFMLWDHDTVDTVNIGVQHYGLSHVGNSKVKMLRKQIMDVNPHAKVKIIRKKYGTAQKNLRFLPKPNTYNIQPSDLEYEKKIFVIIGIDNMHGRKEIAEKISTNQLYGFYDTWIIDARMGSETFQMYSWRLQTTESIEQIKSLVESNDFTNGSTNQRRYYLNSVEKEEMLSIIDSSSNSFIESYLEDWYSDEDGSSEPCNARSTNYCASMSAAFINNSIRKIADENSVTDTNVVFNFPSMMLRCDTDFSRITS